jgi:hypothetical protein
MSKDFKDDDQYRENRQEAYWTCCVEAYGLLAEALRHLGVVGGDNHDVIAAKIKPDILDAERREAIKQLQEAGALLYDAPFVNVPDRVGARSFWSVED